MTFAAKVDVNQPEIVEGLRQVGYTVMPTHMVADGFPDIVVAGVNRYTGKSQNWLMEIKNPELEHLRDQPKKLLTSDQQEFHLLWRGPIHIVFSLDEALKVVGVFKDKAYEPK